MIVALYFVIPSRRRNLLLLIASYFFYMCWRPEYAILLFSSTVVDYFASRHMAKLPGKAQRLKYLLLSLAVNLGLLFAFKYYGFFRESLAAIGMLWGLGIDAPVLDVLLPVGISFYTFQTLAYTIDVYRGRIPAEESFVRFAVYVSFFPQLVAGPIERAQNLLPQLACEDRIDYQRITEGLKLVLWGMFKKVVVADRLAIVVEVVYSNPSDFWGIHYTIATVFFAYQIYCDFSAYSDIAIGSARMLGIDLMVNFDRPYAARSIPDFWRRWHISLSTWFRDYVYLPLGGNRVSPLRWNINLVIVFVVSGLWHGANWTYVVWGGLHAFYMVMSRPMLRCEKHLTSLVGVNQEGIFAGLFQQAVTFTLVCISWVFFRANSVTDALLIMERMTTGWGRILQTGSDGRQLWQCIGGQLDTSFHGFVFSIFLILFIETIQYVARDEKGHYFMKKWPVFLRWSLYLGIMLAIFNCGIAREVPFIYFQF